VRFHLQKKARVAACVGMAVTLAASMQLRTQTSLTTRFPYPVPFFRGNGRRNVTAAADAVDGQRRHGTPRGRRHRNSQVRALPVHVRNLLNLLCHRSNNARKRSSVWNCLNRVRPWLQVHGQRAHGETAAPDPGADGAGGHNRAGGVPADGCTSSRLCAPHRFQRSALRHPH
jgi:hypothetical protein